MDVIESPNSPGLKNRYKEEHEFYEEKKGRNPLQKVRSRFKRAANSGMSTPKSSYSNSSHKSSGFDKISMSSYSSLGSGFGNGRKRVKVLDWYFYPEFADKSAFKGIHAQPTFI